jgi:cobalamin biosynthesis protein CbiD
MPAMSRRRDGELRKRWTTGARAAAAARAAVDAAIFDRAGALIAHADG